VDAFGSCTLPNTCSYHGTCGSGGAGTCSCDAGFSSSSQCAACDDCSGGPACADQVGDTARCSGNGRCKTTAAGSFSGCACSAGYAGADCSVPPPAGANAAGSGAGAAGAVAAGLLVPLALALLGAAALRCAYPALPLREAAAKAWAAVQAPGAVRLPLLPASTLPAAAARARALSSAVAGIGGGDRSGEGASLLHAARKVAAAGTPSPPKKLPR